jgi:hypothetical protein
MTRRKSKPKSNKRKTVLRILAIPLVFAAFIAIFLVIQHQTYRTKVRVGEFEYHLGHTPGGYDIGSIEFYNYDFFCRSLPAQEFIWDFFGAEYDSPISDDALTLLNNHLPNPPKKSQNQSQAGCEHPHTSEDTLVISMHQRNGDCLTRPYRGNQCDDCHRWLAVSTLPEWGFMGKIDYVDDKCMNWLSWVVRFMA